MIICNSIEIEIEIYIRYFQYIIYYTHIYFSDYTYFIRIHKIYYNLNLCDIRKMFLFFFFNLFYKKYIFLIAKFILQKSRR